MLAKFWCLVLLHYTYKRQQRTLVSLNSALPPPRTLHSIAVTDLQTYDLPARSTSTISGRNLRRRAHVRPCSVFLWASECVWCGDE